MAIYIYEKDLYSYNKTINRRRSCVQHYHNRHELYYLLGGSTQYHIEDRSFDVFEGDFVFVPKGVRHSTDSRECLNTERILISFDDESVDAGALPILDTLGAYNHIQTAKAGSGRAEEILHLLREEYEGAGAYRETMLKLYISELIVCLNRYMKKNNSQTGGETMRAVAEYIRRNYAQDISLSELSEKFFISKSHLSRSFKAHFGVGINEYIRSVRIRRAARLLENTDMRVTDAALMCGFGDSNYFSAVFKKYKGIAPQKYSRLYGGGK
ncbi:MAG: helix-turn-helix domain-containing protein [Clostridiales bacterium]|nr:helix-turn-helix domain-containing protein [Clostridiales bacterium]